MSKNTFFARAYDTTKRGFYFTDLTEYELKFAQSGAEEFELSFIDGDLGALFAACHVDQCNLAVFLDAVESLDAGEQAALFYLVSKCNITLEDAIDQISDVILFDGAVLEAATELFDECYLSSVPDAVQGYIDYASFARDAELNGDMYEFDYNGTTYTCTNSNSF